MEHKNGKFFIGLKDKKLLAQVINFLIEGKDLSKFPKLKQYIETHDFEKTNLFATYRTISRIYSSLYNRTMLTIKGHKFLSNTIDLEVSENVTEVSEGRLYYNVSILYCTGQDNLLRKHTLEKDFEIEKPSQTRTK